MGQQWELLHPVLCDVHDITHKALSHTLRSAKKQLFLFSSWVDQVSGSQDHSATRGQTIFSKAQQGARQLKIQFLERVSEWAGKKSGPTTTRNEKNDIISLLDEQFQSFKRSGQAAAEAARFPTAETVFQKVDELMVEVEDQVEKLVKSKRVQAMTEQLVAEEIFRKADKILAGAEDRMEKMWKAEIAQGVNKRVTKAMKSKMIKDAADGVQRRFWHLASTPAGKKWMCRRGAHRHQRCEEERQRPWSWF
jgi:hypothetical protein